MTKRLFCSLLLLFTFTIVVAAQDIKPPKLTPSPTTEKQKALINEGVVLHDRGDYDGAIAKYQEVLKENPDNIHALYEMGFSLMMKKDYKKSLETAYKGAQYKSDLLSRFYVSIGNNLDYLGESKKSVEVYKKGIELAPTESLLYFNLAVTYLNMNKPDDAKANLKKAAQFNPNHPSSHLYLGTIFSKTGYNIPALFALSRFMVLEPKSERASAAFPMLKQSLLGGASQGNNPNQINVFFNTSPKKDEGDFSTMDMVVSLGGALAISEKNKGKSELESFIGQVHKFFAVLVEQSDKADKSKFAWKHYVPYFVEMEKRNFVEPFAYYISQGSKMEGVEEWLKANEARVSEFLSWSRSYQWAKE